MSYEKQRNKVITIDYNRVLPARSLCLDLEKGSAVSWREMDFFFRFYQDATVDLEFLIDGVCLRQETLTFEAGEACELALESEIKFQTGALLKLKGRITAKDYSDSFEQGFLLIDAARWSSVMLDEGLNFPERLIAVDNALQELGVEKNFLAQVKKRGPLPKAKDDVEKSPRRLTLKEDEERLGVSLPQVLHPLEHFEIDGVYGVDAVFHNVGAENTYSGLTKTWDLLGMVSLFDWFKENYEENLEEHVPDPDSEPEMYARYKETIVVITFAGGGHTLVCWHPSAGWMTCSEESELAPIVDEITGEPLSGMEVLLSSFDLVDAISQDEDVCAKIVQAMHEEDAVQSAFIFDSSAQSARVKVNLDRYENKTQFWLEWQDGKKISYM